MFCGKCSKHVGNCTCPDIRERLESLARSPRLAVDWCSRCDEHHARCRCDSPALYRRHSTTPPDEQGWGRVGTAPAPVSWHYFAERVGRSRCGMLRRNEPIDDMLTRKPGGDGFICEACRRG